MHTHGPTEGRGTLCPERRDAAGLVGACQPDRFADAAPQRAAQRGPAVRVVRRREEVKVQAVLDITDLEALPCRARSINGLIPESITVTVVHADDRRSVSLAVTGKNGYGVHQNGEWGLPFATTAPAWESYNRHRGLITSLPHELLEVVEAALDIRFADYEHGAR